MNKLLTITNSSKSYTIESSKTLSTKVSEECFIHKNLNPDEIVIKVILKEFDENPDDYRNWRLICDHS